MDLSNRSFAPTGPSAALPSSFPRHEGPQRRPWVGMALRFALVVAAACAALTGPALVAYLLGAGALVLTADVALRRWATDWPDGLVMGAGCVLVGLVLVGLAADAWPGGVDRTGWAVGVAMAESAILLAALLSRKRVSRLRLHLPARLGWYGAGVALVLAGFAMSIVAERNNEQAPVTLSVPSSNATGVVIAITSSDPSGPYTLVEGSGTRPDVLVSDLRVAPRNPVTVEVPSPTGIRIVIRLLKGRTPSGPTIREVIVQRP